MDGQNTTEKRVKTGETTEVPAQSLTRTEKVKEVAPAPEQPRKGKNPHDPAQKYL